MRGRKFLRLSAAANAHGARIEWTIQLSRMSECGTNSNNPFLDSFPIADHRQGGQTSQYKRAFLVTYLVRLPDRRSPLCRPRAHSFALTA